MNLSRLTRSLLAVGLVLALGVLAGCGGGGSQTESSRADSTSGTSTSSQSEGSAPDTDEPKQVIKFADMQWQSLWINNAVAQFVIEHGYGYPTETVEMTTPIMQQAIVDGEVDVTMELWRSNIIDWYNEATSSGKMIDLGPIITEAKQGWYVPRYVIEGDPERGIEPMAPDLKFVFDLPRYKELFKDPEEPSKGVLVSCITGWNCAQVNLAKLHAYGLADDYNVQEPGASAALDAAIAGAYKKGNPILAYYWEPTWLLGAYDMVMLEEPEFTEECNAEQQKFIDGQVEAEDLTEAAGCGFPVEVVTKGIHPSLKERAPEVVEFLEKVLTDTEALNKVGAYMEQESASAEEAAIYFFENYQEKWREWMPDDIEAKVEQALIEAGAQL